MSRENVMSVQFSFQHGFGLLEQFIEVCPDEIWLEKNGGWPVWQQVYHALGSIDFFVRKPDDPVLPELVSSEVSSLTAQGTDPVTKEAMRAFAVKARARADAYIASLQDTDLPGTNEGLSQRTSMTFTHGATVGLLGSHTLYHVGSCDAALRDHGLKGVF